MSAAESIGVFSTTRKLPNPVT